MIICAAVMTTAGMGGAKTSTDKGLSEELQAARVTTDAVLLKMSGTENDDSLSREKLEKLAAIYERIAREHPRSVEAWNAEGEFFWRIDRKSDALTAWEKAEVVAPDNAVVMNHLGTCRLGLGNAKQATICFEQAVKLDPKNAAFQSDAGIAACMFRHEMTGDGATAEEVLMRALEHFRQASALEPENADYALAYAETFYMMAKPDWNEALKAWAHVLEVTAEKDFAYANLARVNLKLGRKEEAKVALGKIASEKYAAYKRMFLQKIEGE